MERSDRLRVFIQELNETASAATHAEARILAEQLLNNVEDRYSGVEYDPTAWRTDGRMYPPQDDREVGSPHADVRVFKAKHHYILFGSNGAIRIVSTSHPVGSPDAKVWLDKPGADGRCCP
jgi:hypothetical protein